MKKIFLFAGEKSGDIHGEKLVSALFREFPTAKIYGVGGPKMRSSGLTCVLPMEKFEVMGFVDVFLASPRLYKHFLFLRNLLLKDPPDVVIFIDYPGFSLALAKSLHNHSFPGKICHYICPSVWAWGKKRIPKMEKILDKLFITFPFEKELFDLEKLSVDYVGHPLLRQISQSHSKPFNIDSKLRVLAVFPGSRKKELYRNFPLQLRAIQRLLQKYSDLFIVVSVSEPKFSVILEQLLLNQNFKDRDRLLFIDSSQNQALMKRADLAIAKSGTINLELALFKVPTIVTYGIGPIDLVIAKNILKINLPHYSLPNIIMGKRIFPELIGPHFTEETLFDHANHFLSHPEALKECREKCGELDKILENKQPEQEIVTALKTLL